MIPQVNLVKQYRSIAGEIDEAVLEVIRSGKFILDTQVAGFERAYARYCNARYCVGVASGTDALLMALRAVGIKAGDEVIVPVHTFISTIFAVLYAGAKPVLADVDPSCYTIDAETVKKHLTPKTRAVVPVHMYGFPVDMDPILVLAKKHRLFVIEDACQSHGARYKGKPTGSIGHAGCFSFYPTKNLGAYGDAGAVVSNNKRLATAVTRLRNVGQKSKNKHTTLGYSGRLDALQAVVLEKKLAHLDHWNKERFRIAEYYTKNLYDLPLVLPPLRPYALPNYHTYVIRVSRRDALLRHLERNGIQCAVHYPNPIHLQPCLRFLGYKRGNFPVGEKLAHTVLSLPMFPELSQGEVKKVCGAIRAFFHVD